MVDVGAFCAGFALLHHRRFDHVYAFEPFPSNFAACRRNIELSNAADRITVEEAAVSATPGMTRLFLATPDTHSIIDRGGAHIDVRAVTVDGALSREHRPVRLMKLDIEGAEVEALRGATGILTRDGPDIVAEANSESHRAALEFFLGRHGYILDAALDGRNFAFVIRR